MLRKDGWGSWATPSPGWRRPRHRAGRIGGLAAASGVGSAASAEAGAPEAAGRDEKPLESETPVEAVEAVSLWKIATSSEVDAWRAAGTL